MRIELHLGTILKKLIGMLMLALAGFSMIAIITFNAADPSFNNASNNVVQNYAGANGALIADPIMQAIGYTIWLAFIFLTVSGTKLILNREGRLLLIKTSLLIALLPMACLAFSVFSNGATNNAIINGHGGFIGAFLKEELLLRVEEKHLMIASILGIIITSLIAVNISLKEWKILLRIMLKSLVYLLLIIRWGLQYLYIKTKQLLLKKRYDYVDNIKEIVIPQPPKASAIIEKKPRLGEIKRMPVQSSLKLEADDFDLPSTSLLKEYNNSNKKNQVSEAALNQNSKILQQVLVDFGVNGVINTIYPGPVVTLYELEPAAGTKSSRVIGLADDIARSMSAISARIAVMPGKNALGIELPNAHREIVYLRELLESNDYIHIESKLPLVLGKNIGGEPVIADLAKMPHLLVAGTTGSGKSVAINTMILSLLYKLSPKECQFIMIDPKMLELSVYEGIPHLLTPVVTEPKKAVTALKWVVKEMESRYKAMSILGVRNINGFNKAIEDAISKGEILSKQIQVGFDREGKPIFENVDMPAQPLPYIVVIVDEMADLMIVAGKDIEAYIQRLAQMARAAGIHIIMATQRPSVDVITGVIKANFPTRISFQVTSKIDSRTILGEQGAEQLLGMGDMLYMQGGGRVERVHGPFVGDKEVEAVVSYWKQQGAPQYKVEITVDTDEDEESFDLGGDDSNNLYDQAVKIVLRDRRPTTSYIQRSLKIGYNRAANLIEQMEQKGVLSAPNHTGKREILIEE